MLELSRAGRHSHGGDRGSLQDAGGERPRGVALSDGSAIAYASMRGQVADLAEERLTIIRIARATGSLTVDQNRVYVPTAGVGEEGQGESRATGAARSAAAYGARCLDGSGDLEVMHDH